MGGWAKQGEPRRRPQQGRGLHGVAFGDMPVGRPPRRRLPIKGLPTVTHMGDEDHEPGFGVWYDITPEE